jgi:TP901 family phage tail tape measure protein
MTGGGFVAGAIVGKLLLDKTGWNQSISAVDKDAAKLAGTAKNLGAKFDEIGQKMQGIGIKVAAVGGVIVASFGGMIKKTADYGDAMHDLSERTGVAVPILTSLSLAAQKSGTSMDGLARGFRLLANQMQAANTGNKTAAALFDSLGIKVANADGSLRDMNDVMLDVAGRFSGMEDGAQKAALAQDLFGRSGMELIPLLNLGADGLKREQEEAAKLGLVLSKDAADAADKFNDNLKSLGGAVQGVGIQIGTMLMPAVQNLVIHLTNIIAKVREWAAAHPGLVTMLGKVALALGILAAAIGPILIALPALIRGLQTLRAIAANPIVLIITTSIPILTKAVADFTHELKNMNSAMQESGRSGFVSFLEGINSGWRRVALGMKDSNLVLSEANALAKLYATEGGKGTKDILLEEVEAADKFTPALQAVQAATTEVTETLTPLAKGAAFVRDVMQGFAGELMDTFTPAVRDMSLVMAAAPGVFDEAGSAAEGLEYVFKAIGDAIGASAATVKVAMWNMMADVLAAYGIIIAKLDFQDLPKTVGSAMNEVSTVVADAMRNIASAIVGIFNFKGLFGAMPITPKFDSSYYDAMVKAAESAYDKITDAAKRAFDIQELRISRVQEAEDRQRSWTEKFEDRAIARGYEREDRKFQHQYEHERDAIEHSKMTEVQKNAALAKLERKYQHEQDVREMQRQHAADVRERARENAAVARERAREEAKYKREQIQAAKLLALQWKHENDLNAIRIAEDAARQAQADKEERRQKSLWFKVKGIFATAIEQMLTIWITNLITPILTSIISKILPGIKGIGDGAKDTLGPKGLGKTVSDAAISIGSIFTTLATTIATVLTTLATGIGTTIVTLATAIGTAVVTLATAIASAAEIIAASAPAFVVVGLIAVGIYATIAALKRLFGGSKTGAGDGMGRVVERQDVQISLLTRIFDTLNDNIKTTLWNISTKLDKGVKDKLTFFNTPVQKIRDYLKTIASKNYLKDVVTGLKDVVSAIGALPNAASGAIVSIPSLVRVAEREPEIIMPLREYRADATPSAGGRNLPVNVNFYVNTLDADSFDRVLKGKIVPGLQAIFNHNGLRVPTGAVGGA